MHDTAAKLGLEFASAAAVPEVARHEAPVPRLGLWVPWADTDTIGWARYSLDQRQIPYAYVRDEDIRSGKLKDKYDVLLYGHVDLELAEQIEGLYKAWGPMPFKKTGRDACPGYAGILRRHHRRHRLRGLAELQQFVDSGGLLITLGNGSMLALEGGLVRGVRREAGGVPRSAPGGGAAAAAASRERRDQDPRRAHARLLRPPGSPDCLRLCAAHACVPPELSRSIPSRAAGCAWRTAPTCLDGPLDRSSIVLEWGDREGAPLVVSGQAWGEANLIGRAAIMDFHVGAGAPRRVQLQPAAPRPEPRGPAAAVERDPQLAGDTGRALKGRGLAAGQLPGALGVARDAPR